jgi:hypothetical protein
VSGPAFGTCQKTNFDKIVFSLAHRGSERVAWFRVAEGTVEVGMSAILRTGVSVVVVALACYTVGVVSEQRRGSVSRRALGFLVAGVFFDITATVFMIIGSGKLLTLHGVIGYSALAAMVAETWFAYRHRGRVGDGPTPRWLHLYTRTAYAWWVVAFVTGGVLVAVNRAAAAGV